MNKLKLIGVRNIPVEEDIDPNADYLVVLMAQREGVYQPDSQGEEEEPITYTLRVSHYEDIKKVGEKKSVKFQKGFTPSQRLRFALQEMFHRIGEDDTEENYEKWMNKLIKKINETGA
jgi:hypothetical protein